MRQRALTFVGLAGVAGSAVRAATVRLRGAQKDGVVSVGLHMLLEILRTLERLATEVALVRLQGDMDANVRGDVIALDRGSTAVAPLAGEVEVVGALAANMALTDVVLQPLVTNHVEMMVMLRVFRGRECCLGALGKCRPVNASCTILQRKIDLHRAAQRSDNARRSSATGRRGNQSRRRWIAGESGQAAVWGCRWWAAEGSPPGAQLLEVAVLPWLGLVEVGVLGDKKTQTSENPRFARA
jgi:hypothetical protein